MVAMFRPIPGVQRHAQTQLLVSPFLTKFTIIPIGAVLLALQHHGVKVAAK